MCVWGVVRPERGWPPLWGLKVACGRSRLAQKALHDVLKLSGGAPKWSWGPEEWFVSTAGGTLPACGVEEVDGERSCLRLLGQEARGRGVTRVQQSCPCRPALTPASAVSTGSTPQQLLLLCVAASSSGRTGPSSLFLPWFSSPVSLHHHVSAVSADSVGAVVTASPPAAPTCLGLSAPFLPAGPRLHLSLSEGC